MFLMDPIENVDIHADSTFVLMLEAQRRGHEVLYAHPNQLQLRGASPWLVCQTVEVQMVEGNHARFGPEQTIDLGEVDAIFMRRDPPFGTDYLTATYILDAVDRRRVVMVNDPQGIRDFNEKLAALKFPEWMPETLICASVARLEAFVARVKRAVVKPLFNAGGYGVMQLQADDSNVRPVLELLTRQGQTHVELQAFIPAVAEGDKRIILLDGQPIGAINRRPEAGEFRANMHVGGVAEAATLTSREREICAALGPELSARGLVLVGIDVIGGLLTEINVTSPTGLQEIGRFDHRRLEAEIIDWVDARTGADKPMASTPNA